jgi:hypothetical protein
VLLPRVLLPCVLVPCVLLPCVLLPCVLVPCVLVPCPIASCLHGHSSMTINFNLLSAVKLLRSAFLGLWHVSGKCTQNFGGEKPKEIT